MRSKDLARLFVGVGGFVGLVLVPSASLPAQEWARKMFQTLEHDFGVVVRGAKAEFEFVLTNPYVEEVHIASVRSSCGCTTPRIKKEWLKTYESSAIVATFNTHLFIGSKGATLTVVFDKPYYAEVQLQVRGYIRSDVVFSPASVELGEVEPGSPVERKLDIHYAGRNDWQILEVRTPHPALKTQLVETARGGGQVRYQLTVRCEGQLPTGYYQDHLILVTNDPVSNQLPDSLRDYGKPGVAVFRGGGTGAKNHQTGGRPGQQAFPDSFRSCRCRVLPNYSPAGSYAQDGPCDTNYIYCRQRAGQGKPHHPDRDGSGFSKHPEPLGICGGNRCRTVAFPGVGASKRLSRNGTRGRPGPLPNPSDLPKCPGLWRFWQSGGRRLVVHRAKNGISDSS